MASSSASGAAAPAASIPVYMPCAVGDKLEDVDTPALCLDLTALRANLDKASELMAPFKDTVSVRPHFKSHKCVALAKMQLAAHSAAGITCTGVCAQKVIEAEALGVLDVFVSNQVVGAAKIRRLVALAAVPGTTIRVVVDAESNCKDLSAAAAAAGVTLGVLVEMDVGQARCGVSTPEEAAALAKVVSELPSLSFVGLHAYQGAAQHIRSEADRAATVAGVVAKAKRAVELIEAVPLTCGVVTGGGTGTFPMEAASGVYNEVQPGSYVVADRDYALNLMADGEPEEGRLWQPAMFLYTTVMSVTAGERRGVLDVGLKGTSRDSGLPVVLDVAGLEVTSLVDEHASFKAVGESPLPTLGTKLRLQPGHCDPTSNHHDVFAVVEDGVVVDVWRVDARSAGF